MQVQLSDLFYSALNEQTDDGGQLFDALDLADMIEVFAERYEYLPWEGPGCKIYVCETAKSVPAYAALAYLPPSAWLPASQKQQGVVRVFDIQIWSIED